MKIGVLSDTHDQMTTLNEVLRRFSDEGVEKVFHAGDYVAPFAAKAFLDRPFSMLGVFGNNDGERLGLSKVFREVGAIVVEGWGAWEIGGRKILVMHEPREIEALVSHGGVDLIVYGHTHRVDIRKGKTLLLNPGEVCGWVEGRATAVIVDLETMEPKIVELAI